MSDFKKALKEVLKHEGGYVNDPHDSGGETNYGITKKTAEAHGYTGSMKDIPMKTVEEIYKKSYWDVNRLDDVARHSFDLANEMFDAGVNMGTKRPAKWFQSTLNMLNRNGKSWPDIVCDGAIGPKTISTLGKLSERDCATAIKVMKAQRAARYIDIVKTNKIQERFLRGWINRVL